MKTYLRDTTTAIAIFSFASMRLPRATVNDSEKSVTYAFVVVDLPAHSSPKQMLETVTRRQLFGIRATPPQEL
jgi:hypothetical protein